MAKLGEAYIQVLADLSKFDKSVDDAIKRSIQRLEKSFDKALGEKLGKNVGTGFTQGFNASLTGMQANLTKNLSVPANSAGRRAGQNFTQGVGDGLKDKDPITKGLAILVSALEDGFSALPAEIKATVGGVLIAALAPAGAAVGAAIGAGIITGIAASGVALAFQFEEVEERGIAFAESLRERLVTAAESFGNETLNAIDELDYQIAQLEPTLKRVFDRTSVFIDPLAQGIGQFLDEIIQGLDRGLEQMDIQGFIDSVIAGFEYLGLSIGDAFDVLLASDNLDEALYDLFQLIGDLVTVGADFLAWSLEIYDNLKPVAEVVYDIVETFGDLYEILNKLVTLEPGILEDIANFFGADDREMKFAVRGADSFGNFNRSLEKTITATEAAQKAVRELNKELDDQRKAARGAIDSQIDYERALDDVTEALGKSKGNLNLTKEAGRQLAEEYLTAIDALDEFTDNQVAKGKLTEKQAKEYYDAEIKRLREQFKARGGNLKQFDELFADYIKLAGLPPIPDPTKNLTAGAENAFDALHDVLLILAAINAEAAKPGAGNIKVPGGTQIKGFAKGGFISEPSVIAAGEGYREEVVLPLTDSRRSVELLARSPLAGLLNSNITNVYAVFDGEPFQARMVRTARGVGRAAARTLTQVPRSI